MNFYFLNSVPQRYAQAFQEHYVRQNFKNGRLIAAVLFGISGSLLLSNLLVPYDEIISHAGAFRAINLCLCFASAVYWFFCPYFRKRCGKRCHLFQAVCLAYCFVFVSCCMAISFVPQQNPKNTMTFFLMGLICVALIWNFSAWQNLLLGLLIELAFIVGIYKLDLPLEQTIMNHFASVFILLCYFILARMIYSYRANHFMQLKEIEAKTRQIQEASNAKSNILSVVAHDLRSPFASIEMMIRMIRQKKFSPEKEEQSFDMILSSCRASRELINDLLEMARYEAEETLVTRKTDLAAFMQELQADWENQLQGSRELNLVSAGEPVFVNLNRDKFYRVMNNLISNAVKFTPEHGIITLGLLEEDQRVLLSISDNGIGIPGELQPHLFETFSKARRNGLNGEQSTGLGLSICRKLVELHGGTIEVESEAQKGTTFYITLPVQTQPVHTTSQARKNSAA